MNSTVMFGLACSLFLSLTILNTVNGGYIPDLGLPPEALDFTPSDYKADESPEVLYKGDPNNLLQFKDFDFSQLTNAIRRGDYEQQGGGSDSDDKLPAPTSYQLYNLESKNPVPVTIKIKKMQSQPKPEWPQPPAWLQQDSGSDHMSDDEPPATMVHPIPSSSHSSGGGGSSSGGYPGGSSSGGYPGGSSSGGYPGGSSSGGYPSGRGGSDSHPPALGRHPPSSGGSSHGHSSGGSSHGHSSGGPPAHDFPPQDFSPPDKPWQGYNFEETN